VKPQVVIGILGPTRDASGGGSDKRWSAWRPTVAACAHADLPVARLELIHHARFADLATRVAADVATVSPATEIRPWPIDVADPWDFESVYATLYDLTRRYRFAPEREDYLVHLTTGTHVEQICLFLLTEARYIPGRILQTNPGELTAAARKAAAVPGRIEPGGYHVIDLDLSRYDQLAARSRAERHDAQTLLKRGIATRNARYNATIARLETVAVASRAPILLLGPTGSGKSSLARRIHALKRERGLAQGDLVEVNCATLRGDGAMSTLFGHVKGAFTGAAADRPGLLRRAHGGVLFLDEIGELGVDEQAMLLHALEDRRFLPMGADREVEVDVQLVAGTNRDLSAAVAAGRFRDDLLARIDLWTFALPPLRERPEDLEANLDFELERAGAALGRRITMAREARAAYLAFGTTAAWPGNFRDLAGSVTRMATLAQGGRIAVADVTAELELLAAQWRTSAPPAAPVDLVARVLGATAAAALDRFDRAQLAEVLAVCREHISVSDAGRALFAVSRARRTTLNDADRLRKYLARFELTFIAVRARV
jgi:transcriptional regulatory protein RtcR